MRKWWMGIQQEWKVSLGEIRKHDEKTYIKMLGCTHDWGIHAQQTGELICIYIIYIYIYHTLYIYDIYIYI